MITQFRVQNFKALKDVTLDLTPIHVLIGPNDSGKTSIFEAIRALGYFISNNTLGNAAFSGRWNGSELAWCGNCDATTCFGLTFRGKEGLLLEYNKIFRFLAGGKSLKAEDEQLYVAKHRRRVEGRPEYDNTLQEIRAFCKDIHFYRWVPSHLAYPVAFQVEDQRMEPSGFRLAMVLDSIARNDRHKFDDLEKRFLDFFPRFQGIKLPKVSDGYINAEKQSSREGVEIFLTFEGSQHRISASQASDGALLVLAYLAILYSPQPPKVLLIEEPENGIHPQRLVQVIKILRELVKEQKETQVLLTTHSPYVVDQFDPEEVTLCTKNEEGAVVTRRLSESDKVRDQIDIFSLGAIWTAEGDEVLAAEPVSVD